MKERPILFSGEMVRALLEGRKTQTQTRRVVKPQPPKEAVKAVCVNDWWMWERWAPDRRHFDGKMSELQSDKLCPYGKPGDRLWVKETWAISHAIDHLKPREIPHGAGMVHYTATENIGGLLKRVSIFMPRWASRLTLEVTEVRVERVQDISSVDAIAEGLLAAVGDGLGAGPGFKWHGIGYHGAGFNKYGDRTFHVPGENGRCRCVVGGPTPAQCAYRELWDKINGAGAWEKNPWVWVIGFKRVTA